jgi:hypothetical protein
MNAAKGLFAAAGTALEFHANCATIFRRVRTGLKSTHPDGVVLPVRVEAPVEGCDR